MCSTWLGCQRPGKVLLRLCGLKRVKEGCRSLFRHSGEQLGLHLYS